MTPDEKKALAHRYYDEFWRQGNADAVDELMAETLIDHTVPEGGLTGRDGWKDLVRGWRRGFPDMHEDIELMLDAEDGCVVCRFVITGTHTGEWFGIPATGRRVRITGTDVLKMADGRITEIWYNEDTLGLLRQMGVVAVDDLPLPGSDDSPN